MRKTVLFAFASVLLLASSLVADGPADNQMETVRSVPPPGIAIGEEQRGKLVAELQSLKAIASAKGKQQEMAGHY
jgi:hypothetical protein